MEVPLVKISFKVSAFNSNSAFFSCVAVIMKSFGMAIVISAACGFAALRGFYIGSE